MKENFQINNPTQVESWNGSERHQVNETKTRQQTQKCMNYHVVVYFGLNDLIVASSSSHVFLFLLLTSCPLRSIVLVSNTSNIDRKLVKGDKKCF